MEIQSSILECPFCNRIVQFSHEDISLLQHDCGVVLQRNQGRLVERAFATIQHPVAIIQKGTSGQWEGKSFTVLGRIRAWLKESVFNYWTIIFDDSSIGYLAEGYGLYAIYQKSDLPNSFSSDHFRSLSPGQESNLSADKQLILTHANECHRWEMEGEIYLPDEAHLFKTYEFASQGSSHLEAFVIGTSVFLYDVHYVPFITLALSNTRPWVPYVKVVNCTQCAKPNKIKTYPYAQCYGCIYCGARHSINQKGDFILHKQGNRGHGKSDIKLGATGIIKGINYEVAGYALKEETNAGSSQWKEYTLFNPEEGYAFLSEYNGHWIYVRERGNTPVFPQEGVNRFNYDDEPFVLFNQYSFFTKAAAGEFPYNLFNDGDKTVKEFISPPEVWINEQSAREGVNWFLGEHLSVKELQTALGDAISLPERSGVGVVEPKGFINPEKIVVVAIAAALCLILIHLITSKFSEEKVILSERYALDSTASVSFVTPKFVLDKWRSNLQFDIIAPVSNSWFELNATLVNASNGTEYTLEQGVEYYYGYTDGESWSEGSSTETAYLDQIPSGSYFLQISGTSEGRFTVYPGGQPADHVTLNVTYDVPNDRNLVYCLIALIILPVIQFIWVTSIERQRWMNSPFSPYQKDE